MRARAKNRGKLGRRIFATQLVVIVVGALVLAATAKFHAPAALTHHAAHMEIVLGRDQALVDDLRRSFLSAVNEIVIVAIAAAVLAAIGVSSFMAWRIVEPVKSMMTASKRIAEGDYHHRVMVRGNDELADLGSSFNSMADALENTERRRLELIGTVAHELRTPLSVVRGTVEALMDGVIMVDSSTLLDVHREVCRLQRLVDDLQELSRAEARQIRLELAEVELTMIVGSAAERLRPQFVDREVGLELDFADIAPMVRGDSARLTQVMLNLIGNALQYTPSGGRVVVRVTQEKDAALVFVEDNGIGIESDQIPHIFERFYRIDASRSRAGGGTGIGLTIAVHLAEAHGGSIQAHSEGIGKGTTFVVTLPIAS